ncbi:hypothetical protein [Streptomyces sp. NBC_01506]|uniref:hypothetical protein n=1 Tax=Streptomyces sp. NBC_01506 TaxID=2903887 RepID=UPI00386D415E
MAFSYRELISVFDHMRRAAVWTRRHLPIPLPNPSKGRHRRRSGTSTYEDLASTPALRVGRPLRYPKHADPLRAEDHALVRPYLLAHEERARQWYASRLRTLLVNPYFQAPRAN